MGDVGRLLAWCPEKTESSLKTAINERWDWVEGWVPVPAYRWVRCGHCGSRDLHYSQLSFASREPSTFPLRAEVQFKCTVCSAKIFFGIPVSRERWEREGMRMRSWTYHALLDELGGS